MKSIALVIMLSLVSSFKVSRMLRPRLLTQHGIRLLATTEDKAETGDVLITALNGAQDISIKVVSCRELIQETIIKLDLTPQAAKALGELVVSTLMMGSGLKGEETLQVNLVGNTGVGNLMAITDGNLKVRGMIGQPRFSNGQGEDIRTRDLLGEGQVQVVRNHPAWKNPTNGIVLLRDIQIPLNLAFYMAESEQRSAVMLTDVKVEGGLCRYALGVMVERLPGATEENIDASIANLGEVEKKGLRTYLDRTPEERQQDTGMFRDFTPSLDKIIDECLGKMGEDSIRWSKSPEYRCTCGPEKVWRTLRLLPLDDVRDIVKTDGEVEVREVLVGTLYLAVYCPTLLHCSLCFFYPHFSCNCSSLHPP